jgi:hypothetical protein
MSAIICKYEPATVFEAKRLAGTSTNTAAPAFGHSSCRVKPHQTRQRAMLQDVKPRLAGLCSCSAPGEGGLRLQPLLSITLLRGKAACFITAGCCDECFMSVTRRSPPQCRGFWGGWTSLGLVCYSTWQWQQRPLVDWTTVNRPASAV